MTSAIINVALFLPHTISFEETPARERQTSPPILVHKRARSAIELQSNPSRLGSASDLTLSAIPPEPSTSNGYPFVSPFELDNIDLQRKHLQQGPHVLARSEAAHILGWGKRILNQPPSQAEPLPSASIQDFSAVCEQQKSKPARLQSYQKTSASSSSRAQSGDRDCDDKSWSVEPAAFGNGGLFNAIRQVESEDKETSITWIGTLGFPTDTLNEKLKLEIADKLLNQHRSEVVFCSDKDLNGHYAHYCKTILWPIFHYRMPDHIKSKAYADHSWKFYRSVNRAFADKIIAGHKRGDTIWIHDYHLLLVPGMVREKYADAKIGFFLHVGFPSSEVFRCLAMRKELLEGLLGANLIVFQIEEYAAHFLQSCSRFLTVETNADGVQLDDRFVNVTSQGIGINPPLFEKARQDQGVHAAIEKISTRYKGKTIIVARDKLDHVQGIRQKLLAFEIFLRKYPEWADKVVLIQVATSSAEQSEILSMVAEVVNRIESAYSTLSDQPLVFLQQDIGFSDYIALLTIADVLMVTPLRDGMNLTAHDFVFLQDGKCSKQKHGPLILSEFAGSHSVFDQDHLSINPWDYSDQADTLNAALKMTDEEKERRWAGLHATVLQQTGAHWFDQINLTLAQVHDEHHQRAPTTVPRLLFTPLNEKYRASKCRIFIIDYEGTLAPHKTISGTPLGSRSRVIETLSNLMMDPKNIVYVMSACKPEELANQFRTLPAVGLIAENGCFVQQFGVDNLEWTPFIDAESVQKWKIEVRNILEYWQERVEGSFIEERHCSLIFHYEHTEGQEAATRQAGECIEQINGACKYMHLRAVPISKAILIEQEDFSKSTAAKHIFEELARDSKGMIAPDFLMVAGDDREDEVAFHWANGLSKDNVVANVFTVTVGSRNTEAQASLTQGSTGLLTVLQKLASISAESMPRGLLNSHLSRTKTFPA